MKTCTHCGAAIARPDPIVNDAGTFCSFRCVFGHETRRVPIRAIMSGHLSAPFPPRTPK